MSLRYPDCPECGGQMTVNDSRHTGDINKLFHLDIKDSHGALRRRRACSVCDYRFTSYEVSKDDIDKIVDEGYSKFHCKCQELQRYVTVLKAFIDNFNLKDAE